MGHVKRFRGWAAVAVGVAMAFGVVPGLPTQSAKAYPSPNVELQGHGWGHGRGMGQWGALGYAVNHGWDYRRILGHFYSNTVEGSIGNAVITVRLLRFDGRDTIVYDPTGTARWQFNGGTPTGAAHGYLLRRTGANRFAVYAGGGCGGPWTLVAVNQVGPVTVSSLSNDGRSSTLQMCEAGGNTIYRNDIQAAEQGTTQVTINSVFMENYLRGVVPRESPASWGDQGGGKGMEALRAQAVAARSYSWSENRYTWAKTCDTTSCQVYGGVNGSGGEQPATNQAIDETAGQVRVINGVVQRTEFSSSTGGVTAGGKFPSVIDQGDNVCLSPAVCNKRHSWTDSIPVSEVQAKYPSIGTLETVAVTERTPEDGGMRAKTVQLRGSSGTVTLTGDQFRVAFGLNSTWFYVSGVPSGGVNGYWLLAADAGIFSFGKAPFYGSMGGQPLNRPVVGMAATKNSGGYWNVASDGGIFAFGNAQFYGSMGGAPLNKPIVGMAATPTGGGYWLVASDGGIFAFGDAQFHGSMGGAPLNKPVVGMASTPSGQGYWMVATDGGIFAFGDAQFYGSTGGMQLARPIRGMTVLPGGGGYWMVAEDGGIFAFNAPFYGSLPAMGVVTTAAGMRATATGGGYNIVAANGDVYRFGDAPFFGGVRDVIPGWTGRIIDLDLSLGS